MMFFITCEAGRCRDHEDPQNIIGNDVILFSIVFDVLEGTWRPLPHCQYNGHLAFFHCILGTGGYDCVYHDSITCYIVFYRSRGLRVASSRAAPSPEVTFYCYCCLFGFAPKNARMADCCRPRFRKRSKTQSKVVAYGYRRVSILITVHMTFKHVRILVQILTLNLPPIPCVCDKCAILSTKLYIIQYTKYEELLNIKHCMLHVPYNVTALNARYSVVTTKYQSWIPKCYILNTKHNLRSTKYQLHPLALNTSECFIKLLYIM